MAGTAVPAMSGPARRSTESTSRPGTALSSTGCASLSMAPSCTFRGDIARQTTRRAASFDTWAAVLKTKALWSAFRGPITSASAVGGAVSGQRAEWPGRRPGPGWGDGWAVIGDAATAAGRLIWGQAFGGVVSISRVQPMLVDRSALSGIAGNCSGHPLRTRFVLADGVGTVRTLALSRAAVPFERSGTSCRAFPSALPFRSAGGRAADPGVPLGNPRSAWPFSRLQPGTCCRLWRWLPSLSRGLSDSRRWRPFPRCLVWRGTMDVPGRGVQRNGGHGTRGRCEWQAPRV